MKKIIIILISSIPILISFYGISSEKIYALHLHGLPRLFDKYYAAFFFGLTIVESIYIYILLSKLREIPRIINLSVGIVVFYLLLQWFMSPFMHQPIYHGHHWLWSFFAIFVLILTLLYEIFKLSKKRITNKLT